MPNTTPAKLERIAELETIRCLQAAEQLLGIQLPSVVIRFTLSGTTAGKVRLSNGASPVINYNRLLLHEQSVHFLAQTIPHEVAHVVVWHRYGRRARPHGAEWQRVVTLLGGQAQRCHSYPTQHLHRRHYQRIEYRCGCQSHQLTLIRHYRIIKGQGYRCRHCQQLLARSL